MLQEQQEEFVENDNRDVLSLANSQDEIFDINEEVEQEDDDLTDTVEPKPSTAKVTASKATKAKASSDPLAYFQNPSKRTSGKLIN